MASGLDASVLVLNRNYTAIHVIGARRAFRLLCKDHAEVVTQTGDRWDTYDFESWIELSQARSRFAAEDDGDWVRTVSFDVRVPRIIRLLLFSRMPRRTVKFNRRNIFARDGNRCQYCGRRFPSSELSLDHVVPRSRGGASTWENMVCACTRCNARKGGRLPGEAGMKLIHKPRRPRRSPVVRVKIASPKYESWRYFVDEAYWSVPLKD
jgi:5-methylcytosine-specific restriction endonuclease McrA